MAVPSKKRTSSTASGETITHSSKKQRTNIADFFQKHSAKAVTKKEKIKLNKEEEKEAQIKSASTDTQAESTPTDTEAKANGKNLKTDYPNLTLKNNIMVLRDVTSTSKGIISTSDTSSFKEQFRKKLTKEQLELLHLELITLEDSWFEALSEEFLKPYFLTLKRFLAAQRKAGVQVFPRDNDIYSWSLLTPLNCVKVIILGQDPYHNVNQAHGLAFSVKDPTPPPPSLKNMYKALKIDYPDFVPPNSGNLTKWARQGVLLLNTCLTVKAHSANSHAKRGWEQFTERVLATALRKATKDPDFNIALLLWGTPAQKRIANLKINLNRENVLILKTVHPSPLSASRGYFDAHHYRQCNTWLEKRDESPIEWALVEGNHVT